MRAFGTESPLLLQQGCLRRWDAGSIRGNPAFASAARRIFRSTALTLGILLAVTGAVAQTGSITVLVTDCAGQPLPGAVVIISHATGAVKTTDRTTDKTGRVDFPVLRAGRGYSIEVSLSGFRPDRWDDLRVAIGETVALTTPLIQAGESSDGCPMLGPSVQRTNEFLEFVADLPMRSRVYQNVLALDPGVQDTAGDGNLNVHGSRSRDFQAVVSGVGNVDPSTGRWLGRINLNSIEEMEVVTAGAGVEFGRAQGGFTRIVQKQGGNTHEGVFEFYWQTSKLDGNGAADSSAGPDPEFETYQPFFQFSGPVIEDRLWYRASYELIDDEVPVNVISGIEVFERREIFEHSERGTVSEWHD